MRYGINASAEHDADRIPVNLGHQTVEQGRERCYKSCYLRTYIVPTDKLCEALYCLVNLLTYQLAYPFPVPGCKHFFQLICKITDSLVYTDSLKHIRWAGPSATASGCIRTLLLYLYQIIEWSQGFLCLFAGCTRSASRLFQTGGIILVSLFGPHECTPAPQRGKELVDIAHCRCQKVNQSIKYRSHIGQNGRERRRKTIFKVGHVGHQTRHRLVCTVRILHQVLHTFLHALYGRPHGHTDEHKLKHVG